ncbi:MAG: hypothetical protein K6G61_02200 [Solobacterium sp.]|nr:hypothetical protein [Solobacterium sp.]
MRILVYGAGVIGSNLAADLYASGKDVTLLARGAWADVIEKNGLTIESAITHRKKNFRIPVIRSLKKTDLYDVIFVVLRSTQADSVTDVLRENISRNIVFTGNSLSAEKTAEKLKGRNVMFAFYMAAGRREEDRVVSFTMKKITIGQLEDSMANEELVRRIFSDTKIRVTYEPNMGDYLLCHAAFVVPVGFACYHCDGDLGRIKNDKEYLNRIIDANIEGYQAIENAGHVILPASDQDYHSSRYRKLCYAVYKVMCSTPIGTICASNHAMNAADEMLSLSCELKRFFDGTGAEYPVYKELEADALEHLQNGKE